MGCALLGIKVLSLAQHVTRTELIASALDSDACFSRLYPYVATTGIAVSLLSISPVSAFAMHDECRKAKEDK